MTAITGVVATVCRPEQLNTLVASWDAFVGGPLVIVDQSKDGYAHRCQAGHQVIASRFGIGGPAAYAIGVQAVDTELYAMLEDDFILTPESDYQALARELEEGGFDLVAGQLRRPVGKDISVGCIFEQGAHTLHVRALEGYGPRDYVTNHFVARRQVIVDAKAHDPEQQTCGHLDFYLSLQAAGAKVALSPSCPVVHNQTGNSPDYAEVRSSQMPRYRQRLLQKWGLSRVTGFEDFGLAP